MRGNILKEIEDVSLEEDWGEGTESIIDISISPDALVDKMAENQIPADVIYLDEHSGISSFSQPGAQSLIRWCGLILERVISGLRAVQAESRWEQGGTEMNVFPRVCFTLNPPALLSSSCFIQHPPETLERTTTPHLEFSIDFA